MPIKASILWIAEATMTKQSLPRLPMPAAPAREYAKEYVHARVPASLRLAMIILARTRGETETEFLTAAIRERIERLKS